MSSSLSQSPPLRRVVYTAGVSVPLSLDDLVRPLAETRAVYRERGITALLVYDHDMMFQVMEGDEVALDTTLAEIARDPAIWGHQVIMDVDASERLLRWTRGLIYVPRGAEIMALRQLKAALTSSQGGDPGMWVKALATMVLSDESGKHPGIAGSDSSVMRPAIQIAGDDTSSES